MGVFNKILEKAGGRKSSSLESGLVIASPLKGQVLSLSDVKDEVFSSGALGSGIAVEPEEGKVTAPMDGELVSLFPTKHALGIRSPKGVEVLIHIGLDTVELEGRYFEAHAEQGQKVKKGQILVTFDLEKIRDAGYVTQVPVLITNGAGYEKVVKEATGSVGYGEDLLVLAKNQDV